jgi:5-methylcytosine-specific restriction protein A
LSEIHEAGQFRPAASAAAGETTSTYLFVWNPKRWPWNDLEAEVEQVGTTGYADDQWSTGNNKHIPVGSRFFVIRLGVEPKGIVGSGITLSAPAYGKHWDEAKAATGAETLHCNIRFDSLSADALITWDELQQEPFLAFRWGVQASGVSLPIPVAKSLEELWQKRIGGRPGDSEASIPSTLPEGAMRKVVVNAYERNPFARKTCIDHYGYQCQVCGVRLEEKFGDIAREFIHVHHIVPIAAIGHGYDVDPVRDLVPVCPTCHAVMHLQSPPLSVAEIKAKLARSCYGIGLASC